MAVGVGHWTECFLGVFSAWPHPQGHTALALLSVGFLLRATKWSRNQPIKVPLVPRAKVLITCYGSVVSNGNHKKEKKSSHVCSKSCTKRGLLIWTQQSQSQVTGRAGASFASGIFIKQDEITFHLPGDSLWRVGSFCPQQSPIASVNAFMSFCDPIKSH